MIYIHYTHVNITIGYCKYGKATVFGWKNLTFYYKTIHYFSLVNYILAGKIKLWLNKPLFGKKKNNNVESILQLFLVSEILILGDGTNVDEEDQLDDEVQGFDFAKLK